MNENVKIESLRDVLSLLWKIPNAETRKSLSKTDIVEISLEDIKNVVEMR